MCIETSTNHTFFLTLLCHTIEVEGRPGASKDPSLRTECWYTISKTLDIQLKFWHTIEQCITYAKAMMGKSKRVEKLQRERVTGCKPIRRTTSGSSPQSW